MFTDQAHFVLVFCDDGNGRFNAAYWAGAQTGSVLDDEAINIFKGYLSQNYDDMSLSEEEIFSKAFADTADRIMQVTPSPLPILAVCGAVIIVAVVVFVIVRNRRLARQREAERMEQILSTPLESFADGELEDLEKKYTASAAGTSSSIQPTRPPQYEGRPRPRKASGAAEETPAPAGACRQRPASARGNRTGPIRPDRRCTMGILDRFTSIVKANINELLDKAEDPEKMVDQYLREMTESLAEVREATAGVMAEERRCKKLVDENRAEMEKYEELARKALAAGNEADARVFLAKKQELAGRSEGLVVAFEGAKANADKMRQMHDKLVADIEELNARKAAIKAKAAVAKTQSKVNEMTSASDRAEGARSAFDRMEAKADEMLDRANAVAELSEKPADPTEDLAKKYAEAGATAAVDDDLARLKKEMGLE